MFYSSLFSLCVLEGIKTQQLLQKFHKKNKIRKLISGWVWFESQNM